MKTCSLIFALLPLMAISQTNASKLLQKELSGKEVKKDPADTSNKLWKKGAIISLNVSQSSLSNWAAGGDNYSLSLNMAMSGFAFYKKEKNSWDNTLSLNLGYVNTTSLGARKNDDRIDFLSKYGRELNSKLNFSMLFNFRSQFFKGYDFSKSGSTLLSSNFLAPAYVLLGAGLDYKPTKDFSIFFSPATARWVIVHDDTLSAKGAYGVKPGNKSFFQFGAFSTLNYKAALTKTVSYTGRLDLFSDYLNNPQNIAMNMTNLFAVKISNTLAVTYSLDLIYDDNIRLFGSLKNAPGLQVKSIIGAGLLLKL